MPLINTTQANIPTQDASQPPTSGGGGGGGGGHIASCRKTSAVKPPEENITCPRCDSPNTKFCYYNNHRITQPRYFCKTCRRYWTQGGSIRNLPIGGSRRRKKSRSASSMFINSEFSSKYPSLDIGGLSLFNAHSPPAIEFQFGGLQHFQSSSINKSTLAYTNPLNLFSGHSSPAMDFQFGGLQQLHSSSINKTLPYVNHDPLMSNFLMNKQDDHQIHGGLLSCFGEIGVSNILPSPIRSLTSINQDLSWRLQQQRLPVLFGSSGGIDGEELDQQNQIFIDQSLGQKLEPILYQNPESPNHGSQSYLAGEMRKDGGGLATEWFIDGGYEPVNVDPATVTDGIISGNYENGSYNNWNNGNQGSNQFNHFGVLS